MTDDFIRKFLGFSMDVLCTLSFHVPAAKERPHHMLGTGRHKHKLFLSSGKYFIEGLISRRTSGTTLALALFVI